MAMPLAWRARRPEADQSNLGRCPETFRWAPIAGTPADIDPELSKPVQPCRIRLVHADEKVPGPELTAVCVPGKLQVKSSFSCRRSGPGLMSEQDLWGLFRAAVECLDGVATVQFGAGFGWITTYRRVVVYPRDSELCAIVIDDYMIIQQGL